MHAPLSHACMHHSATHARTIQPRMHCMHAPLGHACMHHSAMHACTTQPCVHAPLSHARMHHSAMHACPVCILHSVRHACTPTRARLPCTPCRQTCHVSPADKLDREDSTLLHDGDIGVGHAEHRVGHNVRGFAEPPGAGLVEDLALEGHVGQQAVKGTLSVRGHDGDPVTQVVRVAYLALPRERGRGSSAGWGRGGGARGGVGRSSLAGPGRRAACW